MSKMLLWIGQFDNESNFEKYMDQTAFYHWWKEYDENNQELSCQFCKELGITSYDNDFLIMKYSSTGIEELLNIIPIDTNEVKLALKEHDIEKANAAILYNYNEDISYNNARKSELTSFLGIFNFELHPVGTSETTAGLRYMTWIGKTDKSRDEFMEYFNQDSYLKEMEAYESGRTKKRPSPDHRCQFCKDLNIKFYYPEFLRISIHEGSIDAIELIQKVIQDSRIPQRWIEDSLKDNAIGNFDNNCAFCYIPNGFREKKKDQKVFILKESMKGLLGLPKKCINELNSYNGIKYLSTFKWE